MASSIGTGIAGLDDILGGGLPPARLYLVEGDPGAGKTTLGLQFLLEGQQRGQRGMYVTLSETREELEAVAASHGWSLDGLMILELRPPEEHLGPEAQYTLFHPSEVELGETTRAVLDEVAQVEPARLVVDSLSELRLLARDPLRYRRQILTLKQHFAGRQCTVLFLDDRTGERRDMQVESLAHGVLSLEHRSLEYGAERRRLKVLKLRGVSFRSGYHDYTIKTGGLVAFPRLVAAEHRHRFNREATPSGVEGLDELLGGGLERGTSTALIGPSGAGKSVLGAIYASEAARRRKRALVCVFDENLSTYLARSSALGIDLEEHLASGAVTIQQIDPAELSPGEFVHRVRSEVGKGVELLVLDSANGFLSAMPEERLLTVYLHELLMYLGQQGVTTLLLIGQPGVLAPVADIALQLSYFADTVVLLRFFESNGAVRQAISVVKKRTGPHERTIREFFIAPGRITVGQPLREFRGILTGVPVYSGSVPMRDSSIGGDCH